MSVLSFRIPEVDAMCGHLLAYTPSAPSPESTSVFQTLQALRLPMVDTAAQSVASDIVVLHPNGDQEESTVLNLKGPDDLEEENKREEPLGQSGKLRDDSHPVGGAEEEDAVEFSRSVEVITQKDAAHLMPDRRSLHLGESPQEPPMKIERRDVRSPCTPPEMDDNEGFTTADFFIDESLPSSMTESARSRKLVELTQAIQEKTLLLESRDLELQDMRLCSEELRAKLSKMVENFRLLQDVAEKGALQLKCEVLGLEKQTLKEKDDLRLCVDSLTKNIVDTITRFEEQQQQLREQVVEGLRAEKEHLVEDYEQKLDLEREKVQDLEREVSNTEKMFAEKCESLERLTSELETLRADHEEELTTARNQMVLEHEVEMDKAVNELRQECESKEKELAEVRDQLGMKHSQFKELALAKEALEASFAKEKEQCLSDLQQECDAKLARAAAEARQAVQKEADQVKVEMERNMATACEEVKMELGKQFQEERHHLREEHERQLQELESALKQEAKDQVAEVERSLSQKFNAQIREMEESFKREREELMAKAKAQEEEEPVVHLIEDDYLPLERHGEIVTQMKEAFEEEKRNAVAQVICLLLIHKSAHSASGKYNCEFQALEDLKALHAKEMNELTQRMDKERKDSLQTVQSSLTAEKQVPDSTYSNVYERNEALEIL